MQAQKWLSLFLILLLVHGLFQSDVHAQAAGGMTLEDGTPVKLRISRTVSSADAHVGDTVDFVVEVHGTRLRIHGGPAVEDEAIRAVLRQ